MIIFIYIMYVYTCIYIYLWVLIIIDLFCFFQIIRLFIFWTWKILPTIQKKDRCTLEAIN